MTLDIETERDTFTEWEGRFQPQAPNAVSAVSYYLGSLLRAQWVHYNKSVSLPSLRLQIISSFHFCRPSP